MPADIRFNRDLDFEYGVLETVAPSVRRMIARNPSPFTFHGTGTYVVGRGRVAVITPGRPWRIISRRLPEHFGARPSPTCSSPTPTGTIRLAARCCAASTPAPTYGFGPHGSGRSRGGTTVAGEEVEEGADFEFEPDVAVRDGDAVECDGFSFECVHTPGHTSNHVCYRLREERALFCGDHVMGWSTTIVIAAGRPHG